MPESSPCSLDGRAELGALLVLLHGAQAAFWSVEVAWRVWRHEERLRQAFVADAEEQKRRGASISIGRSGHGAPEPTESVEIVRIWRAGDRFREEHDGGRRDGYYAVADGRRWWMWDERIGVRSNHDDPSVGSGVGQELAIMLDPTPLLSSLRFRATGRSSVAGRPTVTAHAWPRPQDPRHPRSLGLHQLGTGADEYELGIDQERGVLLAATAIREGQPFQRSSALTIRFDEPVPDETFQFAPPDGEEIQTTGDRHRLQHVTLTEAQQRAPFTVLMPDRVPEGWQVRCTFVDASQRPLAPAQVALSYRSGDGHKSVSISQAAADRASHHDENMVNDENWQEMTRDGTTVGPSCHRGGRCRTSRGRALGPAHSRPARRVARFRRTPGTRSPSRASTGRSGGPRFVFLSPEARDIFDDWDRAAKGCVALLRAEAGRSPNDRDLTDLVGELATKSEEFRSLWAAHNVRLDTKGIKRFNHPVVGDLELSFDRMELMADPGLMLVVYSAEPGSRSAETLGLLASWAAAEHIGESVTGGRGDRRSKDAR